MIMGSQIHSLGPNYAINTTQAKMSHKSLNSDVSNQALQDLPRHFFYVPSLHFGLTAAPSKLDRRYAEDAFNHIKATAPHVFESGTSGIRPGNLVLTQEQRLEFLNQVLPAISETAWALHHLPTHYDAAKRYTGVTVNPESAPEILVVADRRPSTRENLPFAVEAFQSAGIKVNYVPTEQPAIATPVASYLARHWLLTNKRPLAMVVNLSASHNKTPEIGIKFADPTGIAADKPLTKYVNEFQKRNPDGITRPPMPEVIQPIPTVEFKEDPFNLYFDAFNKAWGQIVQPDAWRNMTIAFDAQHGTGKPLENYILSKYDKSNNLVPLRLADPPSNPSDDFHQNSTEVIDANLKLLKEQVQQAYNKSQDAPHTVGVATDGDADRFGAVAINKDGQAELLSINDSLAVLVDLLATKGKSGQLVISQATSEFVADLYRQKMKEQGQDPTVVYTAVGWKYIGPRIEAGRFNQDQRVFLGAEGSGGFSNSDNPSTEKDGLSAALLVLQAANEAANGAKPQTLLQRVAQLRDSLPTKYSFNETTLKLQVKGESTVEGSERQKLLQTALAILIGDPVSAETDRHTSAKLTRLLGSVLDNYGLDKNKRVSF
jgi:phosphomannomutase